MNPSVLALLTLVAPVTSQRGRHVGNGMIDRENIWGEPAQCSDHLSSGPPNADVEIRLGGLPPSTAAAPVHLQWWSPRKSPTEYNVLESPVGCSVYDNMLFALPRYTDSDFNGGNVRVSDNGEAVIRIGSPSTFFMYGRVAIPYIDLRICTGEATMHHARTVILMAGPYRWISPKGSAVTIQGTSRLNPTAEVASSAMMPPRAIIVGVAGFDMPTTTMQVSTTAQVTTTEMDRDVMLSEARDKFDLSALRVSPVYSCLIKEMFFDHFTEGCLTDCEEDAAAAHGQCVRPETPAPHLELSLAWRVTLTCGSTCWTEARNATLHSARLAVASHLDIPFQEVRAGVTFSNAIGRRRLQANLTNGTQANLTNGTQGNLTNGTRGHPTNMTNGTYLAILSVHVATNRLSSPEAANLMSAFAQDAEAMTEVLGIDVLSVARVVDVPSPTPAPQADPYEPAYDELEQGLDQRPSTNSVLDLLPTEAIIGIALGVVVLAGLFGVMLVYKRRKQRKEQEAALQAQKKVDKIEGNEVVEFDAPPAPKQAW